MDAIALLYSEHRKIKLLFTEYRLAGDERRRGTTEDVLIRELSRHVVAEELVFYPFAAKRLDREATDRPLEICSAIKRDLAVLDGHRTAKQDDPLAMAQLERDVADHIDEDEQKLMPRLRDACDAEALRRLAARVARIEQDGPTRPHPAAPARHANLALAIPFLALYDRIRDRVRGRPIT